ncbi:cold shock and DUF1294 domain-containing protein [Luteolibacter marinus]|uniref:cold shock and DUF1294 domain-containing protein n=1 Tax=Luteolibacter marinus TaxID=2776705 RepID=UPI001D002B66|nr:cold shock and DUF1294 domain-containing protein [Luteolibacter marinus]
MPAGTVEMTHHHIGSRGGAGAPCRIVEWHDAKGYGWIEAGGKRVFVHIKDFEPGQRRPVAGDAVSFTMGSDEQGRPRAKAVRLAKQEAKIGVGSWLALALLLVAPWLAGLFLPGPDWGVMALMGVVSMIAWITYQQDKQAAGAGRWRTSESTLHLMEFLGGWPGAFLAQRRFRHKTRKPSYQAAFWGIVLIHQVAAVDVISGGMIRRGLAEVVNSVEIRGR